MFIKNGYFKWKPNFFIVFVAPPGVVSKSTTVDVGMNLLRQVDGVDFGPGSMTWQALTDAFRDAEVVVPEIGMSMSSLTVVASELGTFLDPKNRELVDVLNDLWDGKDAAWERRTKGEGTSTIKGPWLNLLGCTTPSWIQENFPQYAIGGGFTSRTVFVWGDTKRRLIAYPGRDMDSAGKEFPDLKLKLISDLKAIATIKGEFTLTPEAFEWGDQWYEQHWTNENPNVDRDIHGGYLARKQTHIHKVAMVLSAAKRSDRIITPDELDIAESLVSSLEPAFGRIFSAMSANKEVNNMTVIMTALARYRKIEKRNLYRKIMTSMTWQQFELAIEGLIASEVVTASPAGNTMHLHFAGKSLSPGDIEAQMRLLAAKLQSASPPAAIAAPKS